MREYKYDSLKCPNCKQGPITPIGDREYSDNIGSDNIGDGGDGIPKIYQVFTHQGCAKINPITGFTRWTYEVSGCEVKPPPPTNEGR